MTDGSELDELLQQEKNRLGQRRLRDIAACFIDSLSTLDIPSVGTARYDSVFSIMRSSTLQVRKTTMAAIRQSVGSSGPMGGRSEIRRQHGVLTSNEQLG